MVSGRYFSLVGEFSRRKSILVCWVMSVKGSATAIAAVPHNLNIRLFLDCNALVGVDISHGCLETRGPRYFNGVDFFRVSQAEVKPQIVVGVIAASAHYFIDESAIANAHADARADRAAVRLCPEALHL